MSVSAEMWKQIVSATDVVPGKLRKPGVSATLANGPAFSLMHQLFFPTATLRRTSVLFAAADAHSKAATLCDQVAIALSQVSSEMVGIVEASSAIERNPWIKRGIPSGFGGGLWQAYSSRLAERVWRIPTALLGNERNGKSNSPVDRLKELRSTFGYFLFSAAIDESEMPALCSMCEAAVLVVTANVTRREAALTAKQQLQRHRVMLLGTVLDQRTLPIPELIYRRL
jgi:hypothetical protein